MSYHYNKEPRFKPASAKYSRGELVSLYLSLSPPERLNKFLSTGEAAKLTGVDPRTIVEWIRYDKIAAIIVGRRKWRVYRPSIEEFLQEVQKEELGVEEE